MGNKLYVGNLPYGVRDADLEQAFAQFGSVTSAKVMMERDTGRSKGFGFVEMGSDAEAQAAINGMNGQPLGGRNVVVNEAPAASVAAVVTAAAVVATAVAVVKAAVAATAAAAAVVVTVAVAAMAAAGAKAVATAAARTGTSAAPTAKARAAVAVRVVVARAATAVVGAKAVTAAAVTTSEPARILNARPACPGLAQEKAPDGAFFHGPGIVVGPARALRGRPLSRRSNRALGNTRSSLATTAICHGITR